MKKIQCLGGVVAAKKTKSKNITYCLVKSIADGALNSREYYSLSAWQDDSVAFFFDVCSDFEKAQVLFERIVSAQISPPFLEEVLEEL